MNEWARELTLPWFLSWGAPSGDYCCIMLGDREFCRFGGVVLAVSPRSDWQDALDRCLLKAMHGHCQDARL